MKKKFENPCEQSFSAYGIWRFAGGAWVITDTAVGESSVWGMTTVPSPRESKCSDEGRGREGAGFREVVVRSCATKMARKKQKTFGGAETG